ncbi:unnamed protein product [Hapterophycus canaliculatus]
MSSKPAHVLVMPKADRESLERVETQATSPRHHLNDRVGGNPGGVSAATSAIGSCASPKAPLNAMPSARGRAWRIVPTVDEVDL